MALMVAVQLYGMFGPAPGSAAAEAQTALLAYGALALLVVAVDALRQTARD